MVKSKSIFIICGEQSADIHGSLLAKELYSLDPNLQIEGIGGEQLKNAGVNIYRDNNDLAIVGLLEVIKQYNKFKNLLINVSRYIEEQKFDCVILIDYPGFNLRLAKLLKKKNLKIIYYISPQLWAWGQSRLKIIKECVDHVIVIFKFEKTFYEKENVNVSFVGHPLLDTFNENIDTTNFKNFISKKNDLPLIAFLPGSRKSEIKNLMPVFIETLKLLKNNSYNAEIVFSAASKERLEEIKEFFNSHPEISKPLIFHEDVNQVIKEASMVIVASGTASLQTCLYLKPMVVVYKINTLTYYIFKKLVKTKFISIVNLVAQEKVVPELIQNDCNAINIFNQIKQYISDNNYLYNTIEKLKKVKSDLGSIGASKRASEIILKQTQESNE